MVPFFDIAGHIIFGFMGNKDLSLPEKLKLSDANLWHGDSSLSMERWEFWKQRLRWISEQDELMERTRADARKVVQLMQGIEQQNRGINSGDQA
jgi:hypothetical protein